MAGLGEKLIQELDGVKSEMIVPAVIWSCELPDRPATIIPSFYLFSFLLCIAKYVLPSIDAFLTFRFHFFRCICFGLFGGFPMPCTTEIAGTMFVEANETKRIPLLRVLIYPQRCKQNRVKACLCTHAILTF